MIAQENTFEKPAKLGVEPLMAQGDLSKIRKLLDEFDAEFAAEMLELYVVNTRELLANLKQGATNRDAKAVAEPAHSIKGTSANLGFELMRELAAELEGFAKSEDVSRFDELIARLEAELELIALIRLDSAK
jgi:HPt (histidine-containing phosphotransfer) domain-containing protein